WESFFAPLGRTDHQQPKPRAKAHADETLEVLLISRPTSQEGRQFEIRSLANDLLRDGGVLPMLAWRERRWQLMWSVRGVLGALGIQLVHAIIRQHFEICFGCGEFFRPEGRRRPAGRRAWCPK